MAVLRVDCHLVSDPGSVAPDGGAPLSRIGIQVSSVSCHPSSHFCSSPSGTISTCWTIHWLTCQYSCWSLSPSPPPAPSPPGGRSLLLAALLPRSPRSTPGAASPPLVWLLLPPVPSCPGAIALSCSCSASWSW